MMLRDPTEFAGLADAPDAAPTGGMAGLATRSTTGVLPEPGKVCGIEHCSRRCPPRRKPLSRGREIARVSSVRETADMAGLAACSTTDPAADVETPAVNHKITRSPNRQIAFC